MTTLEQPSGENPEVTPAEPLTMEGLSNRLNELTKSVKDGATEGLDYLRDEIQTTVQQMPELIKNASTAYRFELMKQTEALRQALAGAPDTLKNIELPTVDDILDKWRAHTQYFAEQSNIAPAATSGLALMVSKLSTFGKKANEVLQGIVASIKPQLLSFLETPGVSWLLGEETMNKIGDMLGVDRETRMFIKDMKLRLPDNVELFTNVNATKATTLFFDHYKAMISMQKLDPTVYTKVVYFNHLVENGHIDYSNGAKRVLTMQDLAKAAQEYNRVEKERIKNIPIAPAPAAPATPVAPAAADTPPSTAI